jgi:hypothetical protein
LRVPMFQQCRAANARQEGVGSGSHAQPLGGASAGLTAEGESEQRERLIKPSGAAGVRGDDPRQPLGEDAAGAALVVAEELAGVQFEPD